MDLVDNEPKSWPCFMCGKQLTITTSNAIAGQCVCADCKPAWIARLTAEETAREEMRTQEFEARGWNGLHYSQPYEFDNLSDAIAQADYLAKDWGTGVVSKRETRDGVGGTTRVYTSAP